MELGELLVGMIISWKGGTETGLGVPEAESVTRDEFFAGVRAAHLRVPWKVHHPWAFLGAMPPSALGRLLNLNQGNQLYAALYVHL